MLKIVMLWVNFVVECFLVGSVIDLVSLGQKEVATTPRTKMGLAFDSAGGMRESGRTVAVAAAAYVEVAAVVACAASDVAVAVAVFVVSACVFSPVATWHEVLV